MSDGSLALLNLDQFGDLFELDALRADGSPLLLPLPGDVPPRS